MDDYLRSIRIRNLAEHTVFPACHDTLLTPTYKQNSYPPRRYKLRPLSHRRPPQQSPPDRHLLSPQIIKSCILTFQSRCPHHPRQLKTLPSHSPSQQRISTCSSHMPRPHRPPQRQHACKPPRFKNNRIRSQKQEAINSPPLPSLTQTCQRTKRTTPASERVLVGYGVAEGIYVRLSDFLVI